MQYSLESKNMLAKLMATENINIVHQKISTAMFDPKSRTLYCPIWKDMTNELRDLLLGHETGHALETPPDGWHDAVTERGRNYKAFLNVVEDARIEKKIKRRYPGLKRSFIAGYQELLDRDFFGIKNRNVNDLPFIDRLNLHTKGGVTLGITFNQEETDLLNEVNSCETWDDVIRVTEKVYGYSKNEQFELQNETVKIGIADEVGDDIDSDGDDDNLSQSFEFQDEKSESASSSKIEQDDETDDAENSDSKSQGESGDVEEKNSENETVKTDDVSDAEQKEEESVKTTIQRDKTTKNHEGAPTDFEPVCETDDAFRSNEKSLVNNSRYGGDYAYANMPKPIMKNILVPYKKVHSNLSEFYSNYEGTSSSQENFAKEFQSKNERYVSLLAKEFEMRKAASKFAKAKISNTGDLDINKIYKYQVDDSIFKKVMRVPKGKSHGLILLLDFSGSMQNNMASSIEQILVLSMFCRKVNIPFVVYSFGNCDYGRSIEFERGARSFQRGTGEVALSDLTLREYLSSSMNNAEYKKAVKNMLYLMKSFGFSRIGRPKTDMLSNTPLIEAIIALQSLTIDFRKKNNLDIVNLAIIHDGDADIVGCIIDNNGFERSVYSNLVITDPKTKYQVQYNLADDYYKRANDMRSEFFNWYRQTTGAKIFGFFLVAGKSQAKSVLPYRYYDKNGKNILNKDDITRQEMFNLKNSYEMKSKIDEMFDNKCLVSYSPGYNEFYLVPGGSDLHIQDDEIEVNGKVTVSKLKNAFLKYNKRRQLNRVLATKFIEGIAVA